MAWSTREIAEIAGTTVNTIRYYHRVRLLEEPDRKSNGYKQYQVRHLVRLLQIRRLRDLGVPVDQIEQVGFSGSTSAAALTAIDADLAVSIERLQRARAEIRAILQGSSVTDVPSGFENVASELSAEERSLMLVYSQLFDEDAMADVRGMLESGRAAGSSAFEALDPEADEQTRADVAEQYALTMIRMLMEHPWLNEPTVHLSQTLRVAEETVRESVRTFYNPAQLDVLRRASLIARERIQRGDHGVEDLD